MSRASHNTWGFSGKTPISLSGGFSVETLTGATLLWKTELNRSISAIEDGIFRGLQHCHETCCKKGSHHGRRACMVWKWFHHRNVDTSTISSCPSSVSIATITSSINTATFSSTTKSLSKSFIIA